MNNKTIGIVVLIAAVIIAAFVIFGNKPIGNNQATNSQQVSSNSPCASSATKDVVETASSKLGNYLADSKCMTLYVTSADKNGVSSCYDACATNWPPFMYDQKDITKLSGSLYKTLNIIKRKDGTYQYAYGTTPLYYYKGDTKTGDMNGNGMNKGAWSVILLDQQGAK